MALIHPLALALLGAGLAPLLIHLLVRRRGRRLEFPTLRFLVASPARRLSLGRLTHPYLLAARILVIAVLALLLAQPYSTRKPGAERTSSVIVLDESLSLQAEDSRQSARKAARVALAELGPEELAAVVVYQGTAQVVASLSTPAACLEALEATLRGSTDGASSPGSAHGAAGLLALRLLQGQPGQRQVIWISDFRGDDFESLRRRAAQSGISWRTVSVSQRALANDAPAAVRMEQGDGRRLRLWVDRFSDEGSRGEELSWALDATLPQRLEGALQDGRGVQVDLSSEGAFYRVAVALHPGDAVDADDAASFHIPLRTTVRYAVLGPDPEFVVQALQSAVRVNGLGLERWADPAEVQLLVVSDLASASPEVKREVADARRRGVARVLGGALRWQGVHRRLARLHGAGLESLLPVTLHGRPLLESVALQEPNDSAGVLVRFQDGSAAVVLASSGETEIVLGFPLTGPPRGPGLESWFPALMEGLVRELMPQALPSQAVRSAPTRRESALIEPTPPGDASVVEAGWVDPVVLEQEGGWARPLAVLLLLAALVEGILARRASVGR